MNDINRAEAERRWPSPNSGLYEGLVEGFVLGAEWARSEEGSCWDEGPQYVRPGECGPMPPRCQLKHGHGGAHREGRTEWMRRSLTKPQE